MTSINKSKKIGFHAVGDTGNNGYPTYQNINTESMQDDINNSSGNIVRFFFYHLGDGVYQFGEPIKYYDQFYYPIIELYSNTDEYEGQFDPDQVKWFVNELKSASKDKALM
jgi:hypothetical protein